MVRNTTEITRDQLLEIAANNYAGAYYHFVVLVFRAELYKRLFNRLCIAHKIDFDEIKYGLLKKCGNGQH